MQVSCLSLTYLWGSLFVLAIKVLRSKCSESSIWQTDVRDNW